MSLYRLQIDEAAPQVVHFQYLNEMTNNTRYVTYSNQ